MSDGGPTIRDPAATVATPFGRFWISRVRQSLDRRYPRRCPAVLDRVVGPVDASGELNELQDRDRFGAVDSAARQQRLGNPTKSLLVDRDTHTTEDMHAVRPDASEEVGSLVESLSGGEIAAFEQCASS